MCYGTEPLRTATDLKILLSPVIKAILAYKHFVS